MSNKLYELTVDNKQLSILNKALSDYICWQYDGIDQGVVDVAITLENIKVAQDMKAVINYQLGKTTHPPKQTSNTSLIWCKEIDLDEQEFKQHNDNLLQKQDDQRNQELNDYAGYAESCLENFLKNHHKEDSINPSKAWNNVKERHWDTIKRTGDK